MTRLRTHLLPVLAQVVGRHGSRMPVVKWIFEFISCAAVVVVNVVTTRVDGGDEEGRLSDESVASGLAFVDVADAVGGRDERRLMAGVQRRLTRTVHNHVAATILSTWLLLLLLLLFLLLLQPF